MWATKARRRRSSTTLTAPQQATGWRVNCRRLQVPATTFTELMNKSGPGPDMAAAPTGPAACPSASRTIAAISPVRTIFGPPAAGPGKTSARSIRLTCPVSSDHG